jgi:hypothetical protein
MTIKLSSLRADLAREAKGDWIAYPDWPGVEFNVSTLNLPEYSAARSAELQRLAIVHKNNIPPDVMTSTMGTLLNTHILHGWRGFDVTYSPQVAAETMTDPANRAVINAVLWCANQISQVEVQFAEGDVKNSAKPSAPAS